MAIGRVDYRKNTNLEAVASAITSMGQEASKKDKPIVLGEKIKRISTDATATPAQVLSGQTFYSAGKKQQGNILIAGANESPMGVSKKSNNDLSIFPPAKYFKGTTESGILLPIGTLRGQGYALQSEVDAKQSEVNTWKNNYNSKVTELANMTTDRNNWKNIANSRLSCQVLTGTLNYGAGYYANLTLNHTLGKVPSYGFALLPDNDGTYSYIEKFLVKLGTKAVYSDDGSNFYATLTATSTNITLSTYGFRGAITIYLFG